MPLFGRKKKDHVPTDRPQNEEHRAKLLRLLAKDYSEGKLTDAKYDELREKIGKQWTVQEIKLALHQTAVGMSAVGAIASVAGTIGAMAAASANQPSEVGGYYPGPSEFRVEQTEQEQNDADASAVDDLVDADTGVDDVDLSGCDF